MSDRPLVSIITPSFRRADFLPTVLASVRAQDYPRVEHIVVDGGSDDGTVEILKGFEGTYDLRWVSEPDGGMYHAINKGLEMARGEIVAYVNTDDAYLPWSVSAAVQALQGDVDVVFGDLAVVKQMESQDNSYVQFYPAFDLGHYLWTQSIGQPTVFWTRRAYEATGGFDTSYRLIADCEYWLRLASSGFIPLKIDEVLAIQVDHGETLRETHAQLLRTEFARLRETYAPLASAPASAGIARVMKSLRWRRDVWMLLLAYARSSSKRWPRFTSFARGRHVPIHMSYALLGLLPGWMRFGFGLTMFDGDCLMEAIVSSEVAV